MKQLCSLILVIIVGLPLSLAVGAMIEIKQDPGGTTMKAPPAATTSSSKETLDEHHARAKDMISHVREEYTKAGCPAMWKYEQCNKLAEVFQETMKHIGSIGGNGGVTIRDSTFYGSMDK